MVERLARSIAASFVSQNHMLELDEDGMGYSNDYDNRWYDCRPAARAAIEAMREPTKAMIEAGEWRSDGECAVSDAWEEMIDTALEDTHHAK